MESIALYLLVGAFAGLLAGLLGVGGGLVIVPFLLWIFQQQLGSSPWLMHLAIGTSLATIVITSISSVSAHDRRGAVRWDLFWLLVPGIVLGGWFGAQFAKQVNSDSLRIFFALFELLVAIQMGFNLGPRVHGEIPGRILNGLAGVVIGAISALVGIGGGTMTVPWLVWHRVKIHQAVGTSAAVGLPIAVAGGVGFIWSGLGVDGLPIWSSGFIYWPAFFGIIVMSAFAAPVGARLAHRLPAERLKQLFALFLLFLSIRMFVS
ncbi:MAG: sulfite exporter TauE/SafE family protein [Gammaproteobacteria bacterium]|uniref:Probable membrane transporter protein n=1 Tax=Candidatus Thiopontia autotrophica TaxID=2841688 RepID=A0A8J6TQL1_9GAMM|nr:sulfite exporter TauE/SafE family protein [Candidatus Thiopontia autotrophica]MBL6968841.1 sulfite exporter TauE/SafE family protein [Gammaproteobacteria bacterium]